jgi:hypothetical protein
MPELLFSERVRHVLGNSADTARSRGHDYIGTEHVLLALLAEGEGVACALLDCLAVDRTALATQIEGAIKAGSSAPSANADLPYTSRTKRVLELSVAAAHELHHKYVGTEHLLLGLLREGKGIGAQILHRAGVTGDGVRAEIIRLLDPSPEPRSPKSNPTPVLGPSFTQVEFFPGMMSEDSRRSVVAPPSRALLWGAHAAVWALAAFAGRLSRVGSQIELHITGMDNAELAPDHLRSILTAPATEFKVISFAGAIGAFVLALVLWPRSPRWLRRVTLLIASIAMGIVWMGYG